MHEPAEAPPSGLADASQGAPPGPRVLCVGGATVDRSYRALAPLRRGTSNPVEGRRSFGGVAHNVAANLARLGVKTGLASVVGEDENGRALLAHLDRLGVDARAIARSGHHATAEYGAVLEPDRSLAFGVADMAIFEEFTPAFVAGLAPLCAAAEWLFVDCNLPAAALATLLADRPAGAAPIALDVVSVAKAARLPAALAGIALLCLNRDEAASLAGADDGSPEALVAALRRRGASQILLSLGAEGLLAADAMGYATLVPPAPARVVDVTGAGDAMIAATLFGLLDGAPLSEAARLGSLAAALTIEHEGSLDPGLSVARLMARQEAAARQKAGSRCSNAATQPTLLTDSSS